MSEIMILALAGGAGVLLGGVFFGGLWWTVRRGLSSKRPTLWFLGSLLLRISMALAGFYVVSGGHGDRLLACLLGFVIARFLVTLRLRSGPARRTGAPVEQHHFRAKEAGYAP